MNDPEITIHDVRYNKIQITVINKAIDLLKGDLYEHIKDPCSQMYFRERITYLSHIASENDNNLFTTRYLRSLHTLFNSYYHFYQTPQHGNDFINADTERYFVYREINDQLEDYLCNY